MRIGIIGSSELAATLAHRLATLGHQMLLAGPGNEDVAELAARTRATPTTVEELAAGSDLVILAMPFGRHRGLPPEAFDGKVVVDATDYYPQQDGPIAELEEGRSTSSELLARHLKGARVVKAFNTIHFRTIGKVGRLAGDVARVAIPIAGDGDAAKVIIAELISDLGFDPVDAGTLADSWKLQPEERVYGLETDADRIRELVTSI